MNPSSSSSKGWPRNERRRFGRPGGTCPKTNPFPVLKRRAIFRKSLRDCALFAIAAIVMLFAPNAIAARDDEVTAMVQGRKLALRLLEQQPAESFTNTGVLKIRGANGHRSEIPVKYEVIVTATNWASIYMAFFTNAAETLKIIHPLDQLEARLGDFPGGGKIVGNKDDRIGTTETIEHTYPSTGSPISNTSFAGSDFSVADLGLEFFHWPEQKVLKKEFRRNCSCMVLESTNPNPATNGYSRVDSWIDEESGGIVMARAYDARGGLLKEFYPKDVKKVKGQWQVESLEIYNVQTGSRTRLEFDQKPP